MRVTLQFTQKVKSANILYDFIQHQLSVIVCGNKIKTYSNYKVQNINMSSFGRGGFQASKSDSKSTVVMICAPH